MARTATQQVHGIITYYIKAYTAAKGTAPVVNRNKCRYWLEAMLHDYSVEQVMELIDYYIEHYESPKIDWFSFNYEKIDQAKQEYEENKIRIAARRKETQKRVEEWRERRERWKK